MSQLTNIDSQPFAQKHKPIFVGSVRGTPLSDDTKEEIRITLSNIRHGWNTNRAVYSQKHQSWEARFDGRQSDTDMIISYIEDVIAKHHSPILKILNGRGESHGTDIVMFISKNDNALSEEPKEKLYFATDKFSAVKRQTTEFLSKVCVEGKLTIPDNAKDEFVADTVRRIVSLSLPQELPLDQQYRNRPIDPDTGKRESVIKFLDRAWHDPWIASGVFNRTYFRKVDEPGEQAVQNWLRDGEHTLPFEISRRSSVFDTELNPDGLKHASRILAAARRQRTASGSRES